MMKYELSLAYRRSVRHMRAANARYRAALDAAALPEAQSGEAWEAAQQELDAADRAMRAARHMIGNPFMAWMFED